jgi:hypothetical protein
MEVQAPKRKKEALPSRQIAVQIDGVHTDVLLTVFEDVVHVLATQRGKVGHVFECESDGGSAADGTETFTVNCVLGARGGVEEVFARQIVAALSETTSRRFLVSLGLLSKDPPVSTLQGLLAVLKANAFWKK